jgi:Lon protease-like protein
VVPSLKPIALPTPQLKAKAPTPKPAPQPSPIARDSAEDPITALFREFEADLSQVELADVIKAEQRAENQELSQELENLEAELSDMGLNDVLLAEDRAERKELVQALEMDLADAEIPDVDAPLPPGDGKK